MDAVQSLTGCTYGKGNLIHHDYGKNAFSFFRRSDGRAIRVLSKPAVFGPPDPERQALSRRVRSGQGSPEDRHAFGAYQAQRSETILNAPLEQLFTVTELHEPARRKARIHESLICDRCGEPFMETRARRLDGQTLCVACFENTAP